MNPELEEVQELQQRVFMLNMRPTVFIYICMFRRDSETGKMVLLFIIYMDFNYAGLN